MLNWDCLYVYKISSNKQIEILGNGSLLSRMRGHDKSVNSLSWCPETSLLASSGLEQNIIVWNNGQVEKTIQLPNK